MSFGNLRDGFIGRIEAELVQIQFPGVDFVAVQSDNKRGVDVAESILDEEFALPLRVLERIPV